MCNGYYQKLKTGTYSIDAFYSKRYKRTVPFFALLILLNCVTEFTPKTVCEGLMPRTKGSKNKPKTVTADFATQIAEKQSAKEALTAEIASITANIDTLKADLKEKKTALKKAEKEVATLEAKKAKADAKAAEEAKKAEAESVLKKLLAEGMSADEILAKLK